MIRLAVIGSIWVTGLLACQTARSETYLSMPVRLSYGYALVPDRDLEQSVQAVPRLETEADRYRAAVSVRLEGDVLDLLEPGSPDFDNYVSPSRPWQLGTWGRLELRDAFIELPFARNRARLGKQQIVWGNLDGIKVLDVLNPQRFREFILEDFADSRIGTWSLYLDLLSGPWRAEFALIPDTTTHELPETDAWFELTAPRFRYGAGPGDPVPPQQSVRPQIRDGTVAVRISRELFGVDLGVVALSGLDFEPLGRLSMEESGIVLEQYHERRTLYGVQAETGVGGLVFRLEASYQPDRMFNLQTAGGLETSRLAQWRVAAAADVDGPFGLFLNLQYLHDQVMAAPESLVRQSIDRVLTVFVRRTFMRERLLVEARWYGELNEDDGMARGRLEYELSANTRLGLSVDVFYGSREGLFGQFESRDRLKLSVKHTF